VLGVLPALTIPVFALTTGWMLIAMIVAVRQALDYTSTARAIAVCAIGWVLAGALSAGHGGSGSRRQCHSVRDRAGRRIAFITRSTALISRRFPPGLRARDRPFERRERTRGQRDRKHRAARVPQDGFSGRSQQQPA